MSQFSRAVSVASPDRRASMRTERPVRPVTSTSLRRHTTHDATHAAATGRTTDMSDTEAVSVARLISLVKERPVLWDRQEEVYKNRKLTRQAWAEICESLIDNYHDLGEHERVAIGRSIIGKWANLRDNWLRYWRKRQELLRVGSSTKSLKKYIHHDQLLFLSKVYDPEGQQEVEEIQVEVDVISDPEFESTVEFDETSQSSWNALHYQPLSAPPLPQDQSERHLYFFHSIMPMICDFDDDQMLEFQAGVLEWIKRVKRRELVNLQSPHSFFDQGVQESNDEAGDFLKMKSEAATQNECFCNSTRQIQVKKEAKRNFSYPTSNYVIPESTSNSKIPQGVSDLVENGVKPSIYCAKSEYVSLKDVISKLEKISGTLEVHKVVSKQDLFGHNFGSLITKLPPKKIQSLKRKIVKEVVKEGFKTMKVESTSRCIKTGESDGSLDSTLDSPHISEASERKIDGAIGLCSSDEKEVTTSILRDTLQNLPFILK